MKHYTLYLVTLFSVGLIYFNLDKVLNFANQPSSDLFLLVFCLIACPIILIGPNLQNFKSVTVIVTGLSLYLLTAGSQFLFSPLAQIDQTIVAGILANAFVFGLILYLIHKIRQHNSNNEEMLQDIGIINNGLKMTNLDDADEIVLSEITRSRHYERPMSVIVVEPSTLSVDAANSPLVRDIRESIVQVYTKSILGDFMRKSLRRIDHIFQVENDEKLVVICPETNEAGARILSEEIESQVLMNLGVIVNCGVSSFPDSALTFDHLLELADRDLDKKFEESTLIKPIVKPHSNGQNGSSGSANKLINDVFDYSNGRSAT